MSMSPSASEKDSREHTSARQDQNLIDELWHEDPSRLINDQVPTGALKPTLPFLHTSRLHAPVVQHPSQAFLPCKRFPDLPNPTCLTTKVTAQRYHQMDPSPSLSPPEPYGNPSYSSKSRTSHTHKSRTHSQHTCFQTPLDPVYTQRHSNTLY